MDATELIREDDSSDKESIYNKILFERPISRLQARQIGLLVGRHARLKKVSDIHEIILALNHDITVVAEAELKQHGVPAAVYLEAGKKTTLPYSNTDEAINTLQDSSYVTVGMDIEISSRLQIFLEKLISSRNAPIVFTSESIGLFKISPQLALKRQGDLYICNTKSLVELASYLELAVEFKPNAGIYNKIGLLKLLAEHLSAHIVCVENYQVLSCSYSNLDQAGVVNVTNPTDLTIDYLYIPILLSLLCDVPNPENDILDRILTAGYLLRKSLEGEQGFVQNLKRVIRQD